MARRPRVRSCCRRGLPHEGDLRECDGTPMSVMTPRDERWTSGPAPRSPIEARLHAPDAPSVRESKYGTPEAHVDVAVASSRGDGHAVNEDAYSLLDGRSAVYVVADGVGGGAMAGRASRELVVRLHERLDAAPPVEKAVRLALLEADRGDRPEHRAAYAGDRRGDGGAVRRRGRDAGSMGGRMGRRLPRLPGAPRCGGARHA